MTKLLKILLHTLYTLLLKFLQIYESNPTYTDCNIEFLVYILIYRINMQFNVFC